MTKSVKTTKQAQTDDEFGEYVSLVNRPASEVAEITKKNAYIDNILSIGVSKNGLVRFHTNKRPIGACIVAVNVAELKMFCAKAIAEAEKLTATFRPMPKKATSY